MKAIYLPFHPINDKQKDKENLEEEINSNKPQIKITPKKCFVAKQLKKSNTRHPFHYQLQYYSRLQGVCLPQEIYNKLYYIKLISKENSFDFSDFLMILSTSNNFLFQNLQLDMYSSQTDNCSLNPQKANKNENLEIKQIYPEFSITNYEKQISNCKLSDEEIKQNLEKIQEKALQPFKNSQKVITFSSKSTMRSDVNITQNSQSLIKQQQQHFQADYKLPSFQSKAFIACPKELRSQIIEFLENNSEKPYSASILSLMYLCGVEGSINKSIQLGQNFVQKLNSYQYFDLGQYIVQGIESQSCLLTDIIFFALNCAEGEIENQLLNDDLPLFLGQDFAATKIKTLFCKLDQDDENFTNMKEAISYLENGSSKQQFEQLKKDVSQFMKVFLKILESNQQNENAFNHSFQNFNLINSRDVDKPNIFVKKILKFVSSEEQEYIESILNKNQNVIGQLGIEFLIKFGLQTNRPFDFNNYIDLLFSAADNLHLKAYSKLATILFNKYNLIDINIKQKLIQYLQQGCKLLIPTCMKVQIQLNILGDQFYRDYKGAYLMMKDLFFLGSDCFRYDLIRLAKHFKDFQFLRLYIQYLQNLGEKNIEILNGLILEKGYGTQKQLNQAEIIYRNLLESGLKEKSQRFDFSLNYRMGKLLLAQGKIQEAEIYFKNILEYSESNIQKLDIICLHKIGKMHEKGLGTPQNLRKAEEVYQHIINFEKEKILQNSSFHPVLLSQIKPTQNQQDRSKLSGLSTKSASMFSSNSDKLSSLDETQILNNLNKVKINKEESKNLFFNKKCETKFLEITMKSKEKLWEVITKNLTAKRRLEKIKTNFQEKIEEFDSQFDLEEFDNDQTGFDTHYFQESYSKPQIQQIKSDLKQ